MIQTADAKDEEAAGSSGTDEKNPDGGGTGVPPETTRTKAAWKAALRIPRRSWDAVRRHPALTAMLSIMALYLLTRLLFLGRLPIHWDESIYIWFTRMALKHGRYTISIAADGKPPLHTWFMMPFVALIKDPLIAGRVSSVACGGFTTVGIFLIGREARDWRLGCWGALFYVLCPFAFWYDRLVLAEALLLTLFVFSIYFAVRAAKSLSYWYIVPLSLFIGAGMLTKATTELLYLIVPFAYLLRTKGKDAGRKRPLLRWCLMDAVSFIISFGVYSLLRVSKYYPMIGRRTGLLTKTPVEVLSHPFDVFFSNAGTVLGTCFVFLTPLLFAAAIAGLVVGIARKWRPAYFLAIWVAVVWLATALVAKHWLFDTVFARFFLNLIPPLMLGAGYLVLEISSALGGSSIAASRHKRVALEAVALVVLLALPVYMIAVAMPSPQKTILPKWVRAEYITGFSAGWGIKETVAFLEREAGKGRITVGGNHNLGLPTTALEIYLMDDADVEFVSFPPDAEEPPDEVVEAAKKHPTFCVFNAKSSPPKGWNLELLESFPKDGNPDLRMILTRVVPSKR